MEIIIENLNRELLISLQKKILKELQEKLSTEDLFYLRFNVDDGSLCGHYIESTQQKYREEMKIKPE